MGVYDVGRDDDGSAFIVLEYIEGTTLVDLLRQGRIEPVAWPADRQRRRGRAPRPQGGPGPPRLKPANILIDEQGKPRVADFGLAVTEAVQHRQGGEVAGTPTYMAPSRSAARAIGSTVAPTLGPRRHPLRGPDRPPAVPGRDRATLFDEILHREPRPPRQIDDAIPRELERICLKCLAKRMTDRYSTARTSPRTCGLARRGAIPGPRPANGSAPRCGARARIVPKGLRSFDADDADFFLDLLPGPRDRDGLPDASASGRPGSRSATRTRPSASA